MEQNVKRRDLSHGGNDYSPKYNKEGGTTPTLLIETDLASEAYHQELKDKIN